MNILVTGAAGFIGSHLVESLLKEGHFVLGLDNLQTGSLKNLEKFNSNSKFDFIEHDIINPFYPKLDLDLIYNLACPASPPRYQADPVWTVKTNTLGVINVLGIARAHTAKILQASTSEIYGDPLEHPQRESYFGNVNTIGPRSCYDEGKRIAETLCMEYHRVHKLPIRIARIFNTYGPNMDPFDGRVVSNFIVKALRNENLEIYGDGTQTRSFCYVADLVRGLMLLMNQDQTIGPINIGNPIEIKVLDFAKEVLSMIPESRSQIVFLPPLQDDPKIRRPDISLAAKYLNWTPVIDRKNGVQLTIEYFRKMVI